MTSSTERDCVREFARVVAEIAREPRMETIRKRWRDVNALRRPDRAPVWCRPVGCWAEIIPEDSLTCRGPWLRRIERGFRRTLHKRDIDDDTPVEPYFSVGAVFRREPANTWGVDIARHQSDAEGGAWAYDPPLKSREDFDRLTVPTFTYDEKETNLRMERAEKLMDGIMPVRLAASIPLSATLGTAAADLRGLEQMMVDMATEPELVHRLMGFLRDSVLAAMDSVETTGLLAANNTGPMTCSDPIGEPGEDGRLTFANLWCMANSQEFDQVSPPMWEEFCLEYQRPIFERYGLVGYGCCEDLTKKIDGVLSVPNLRIFTCSAWTDLAKVQDAVGCDYCIMWRQKASDVVFPDDAKKIRDDLMKGAERLEGYRYQIVLRELETLSGHPDRLHVWTECAKEAAAKYA